ncbi:Non-motile and phage-resistance protein [compost metagenome]
MGIGEYPREQRDADVARLQTQLREALETVRTLERERHEFEHLVDSVVDYAIFSVDAHGVIQSWNAGAERIKGWKRHEIVGRNYSLLYTPEDRATGRPAANLRLAAERGHHEEEGWRQRKDGTLFWAHISLTPMRDADGRVFGFSKVTRDVTELKHAEEAREQAARIRQQVEVLQGVDRMKDQFLSILSHELRTPINAIMGFGSVLDDEVLGPLSPAQHDYLKKMLSGAEVLLALVSDLLDVSRIAAGKFSLEPQPMHLETIVHDTLGHLGPLADQKRQRLHARLESPLPALEADAQRIAQVLTNLVNNAMKYSPADTDIEVSARVDGRFVRVEVTDHGEGIAEEDIPRLFQRFVQLDQGNTRRAGGTGLGLSISKALVQAHGGDIGVESELGCGSTFWFTLPLHPSPSGW